MTLSVRLHQTLSFSPLFMIGSAGRGLAFFPGCSMMAQAPHTALFIWRLLKHSCPEMVALSGCCGHPTACIEGRVAGLQRLHQLEILFERHDIEEVVTCCPNCTHSFRKDSLRPVRSLWSFLNSLDVKASLPELPPLVLHDPCPTRNDEEAQQEFRIFLRRLGVSWEEYPHHGSRALCCGKGGMLMVRDPKRGKEQLRRRVEESERRSVMTSCYSCVDSFRRAGCWSLHGLDLLLPWEHWQPRQVFSVATQWRHRWSFVRALHTESCVL